MQRLRGNESLELTVWVSDERTEPATERATSSIGASDWIVPMR
jgi:hypothetical protein